MKLLKLDKGRNFALTIFNSSPTTYKGLFPPEDPHYRFKGIYISTFKENAGIRFLVWDELRDTNNDFPGRAMLGLARNYGSLVIEVLFLKFSIG